MNKIQSFFYQENGSNIFCTMIGDPNLSKECVIYFAPLFEERMWVQRIAFNFARELWEKNRKLVLIYDYYGYGESDGDSENFTIERCRNDLIEITEFLKNKFNIISFSLWGIRTGCLLAIATMFSGMEASSLVLWMPVLNLKDYVERELRSVISFQASIFKKILANRKVIVSDVLENGISEHQGYRLNNIDGFRFGRSFYKEICMIDQNNLLGRVECPTLILNSNPTANKDNNIESAENVKVITKNITAMPFWKYGTNYTQQLNKIFQLTLSWYEKS